MRCPDPGGALLAGGCTTLLAIQTIINMGVATGILPTTGQTLPFISFARPLSSYASRLSD